MPRLSDGRHRLRSRSRTDATHTDERSTVVDAGPDDLWQVIVGIGGDRGWYSVPYAWSARGALDRLVGGIGLRRCRRDPDRLRVGDALDFWRVEEVRAGELLRLRAEMRLPGPTWLELGAGTDDAGRTVYRQRITFRPSGVPGRLYWWSVAPLHGIVFGTMVRNIALAARARRDRPGHPDEGEQEQHRPA